MAEIALRDYISEIDSLIEGNSYDEAIAHCRFILQQYPKYLEAYRLLGKAALEKEDDNAAIDIFQRVLSVDPEDFVARVGLSIVRDRQGALDDALWHMERGFELMPSNDVIQSELRRLYGRRDGVSPERIALTRGALARMYAQGDLYDEAIAELRLLLKESPDRIDLQILLAEVLWRNEQRNEAASIAERILDKYPYCLKANLLLGEIWLNSGFAEDGERLLRRAQTVDPDNAHAVSLLGPTSPLTEQAGVVNRLEYHAAAGVEAEPAADQVPDWLAGLAGIALDQPESAGLPGLPEPQSGPAIELGPAETSEPPDWLSGIGEQPQPADTAAQAEETPDWMTGLWEQTEAPAAPEPGPEAQQAAELPDWLSPIEPTGPAVEPSPEETAMPDWLSQLAESAEPEAPEAPTVEAGEAAIPDWLSQAAEPEAPAPEAEVEPGLPDWLSQLASSEAPGATSAPVMGTDWLTEFGAPSEIAAPEPATPEAQEAAPDWLSAGQEPSVEQVEPAAATTDWLSQFGAEPAESTSAEEQPAEALEGALPDWLEALRPDIPETAAPPIELPEVEESEIPDWMAGLPAPAVGELTPDILGGTGESAPAAPAEPAGPEVGEGMPSADEALAFLQNLAAGKEEQLKAEAEREADARMQSIVGGKPSAAPVEEKPVEAPRPVEPAAPSTPEAMPSAEEALAFLQSLTVGKEEQLREQAEREGVVRMEQIMGGKPGTSPLRPPTKPLVEPPASAEVAPPPVPEAMPSAEEALAFLQGLTAGKEDQLREQAEREGAARMEQIMGGKPGTSPLRPATKPLAEPEPAPPPEPEPAAPLLEEDLRGAEDALAFLDSLTAESERAPVETQADVAVPVVEEPVPEPPQPELIAETPVVEEAQELAVTATTGYWLQTAEDEGEEPLDADYFERATKPKPAAPKIEPAARPGTKPFVAAPPPEPAAFVPGAPPIGAEEFQTRLQGDPEDHEARLGLARVWWASGDRDESLRLYQELIETDVFLSEVAADLQRNLESFADSDWYRALGDAHMKLGNLARALDAYREALTHL